MKNKQVAVTITGSQKICAVIDGKSYTVDKTHKNYDKILDTVKVKDWDEFVKLVDLTTPIRNYVQSYSGKVEINDGVIMYAGEVIHNTLTTRILEFMQTDLPFEPLVKFLENLMQNPSKVAVDELYDFLEVGALPITEDGYVLCFKNLQSKFYSIHGNPAIKPIHGKVDEGGHIYNGVGEYIEIRRNQVNEDRNQTCSDGLHVASIGYLPNFVDSVNGKTVICKVHPKDFVSIPSDYANQKARVCAYTVLSEYLTDWRKEIEAGRNGFDAPIYSTDGSKFSFKPSGHKYWNVRDASGKFVKQDSGCSCGCFDCDIEDESDEYNDWD